MPTRANETVLQLRAQLRDVAPAVWRRLLVPGSIRMDKFHMVLQAAMGWTNSHLHNFSVGQLTYGSHLVDDWEDGLAEIDEATVSLGDVLGTDSQMLYEYDFGDSWEHDVVVEERATARLALKFAVCLDGQNACPPEDSGGGGGYEYMLASLADPADEEHDRYLEWLGGPFDPTAFSLAEVNGALQRLR